MKAMHAGHDLFKVTNYPQKSFGLFGVLRYIQQYMYVIYS